MTNHLKDETSPYLQQHANNPVEWYPWGNEALELAKQSKKPIILSIGYSACHWCHVMAKESFMDDETAQLMNSFFVNIKVDREERPDLDKIYQTTLQLLTGKPGGWPLTLFLTHDNHIPFFGGTYFPKEAQYGLPSFKEVLTNIAIIYQQQTDEVAKLSEQIQDVLDHLAGSSQFSDQPVDANLLKTTRQDLLKHFDKHNGGFGKSPKFPQPTHLQNLLDSIDDSADETKQINAALFSLQKMAESGLFDQIGHGFFRYCVDGAWRIPHFEKMLYDNAQLIGLYADAFSITKKTIFANTAITTIDWLRQHMQSPEGGFYASINAESEGVEGKYYYWDRAEVKSLLDATTFKVIEKHYGLDLPPNFENHWHCYIAKNIEAIANELKLPIEKVQQCIASGNQQLLSYRNKRIAPSRDDKILTAWNSLLIKNLAIASRRLQRPDWTQTASQLLQFVEEKLLIAGRLMTSFKNNQAHLMGYLDDYAFLLDGILNLLQCQWSNHYFQLGIQLANVLAEYFFDQEQGGFYFTAHDHESLIQRPKPLIDEAIPSGNGIAALCFIRLGHILGEQRYLDMAYRTLQFAQHSIQQSPTAYDSLLFAAREFFEPPTVIILRGEKVALQEWQGILNQQYQPHTLIFAIDSSVTNLPEALNKPIEKNKVSAYVCRGKQCYSTLHSLAELQDFYSHE